MKIKRFLVAWTIPCVGLVAIVYALAFINRSRAVDAPPVPPPFPPATNLATQGSVAGSGLVEPSSELVGIGSRVPGIVTKVSVRVGDKVTAGQLLFALETRELEAEIKTRAATVDATEKNLELTRVEVAEKTESLKLYEAIGDPRAMLADELLRRRFAVQTATARVNYQSSLLEQSRASLAQSVVDKELRQVSSPIDGTILQVKVRAGEYAPAAQLAEPLMTLGNLDPLHVRIDIDEADINRTDFTKSATVSPRGSPQICVDAQFIRVEPLVVPKRSLTNAANERVDTRVLQVIYTLPREAKGFFLGQQVDAFIPALASAKEGRP